MEKSIILMEIITQKVIPFISTVTVVPEKQITKIIEIEEGQNLTTLNKTISTIAEEYNIEPEKIFIGADKGYDDSFLLSVYFDTIVSKTKNEIENEMKSIIERKSYRIIYDNMIKNGFKRVGFNSKLLKNFNDTNVYEMIKNNELNKLVSYYSFWFDN